MKPQATFHEILFFTNTEFSNHQFSKRNDDTTNSSLSSTEKLEKDCWDGMLYEMFPDILGSFSSKCQSFIWHVMNGKNFLNVSIGPIPPIIDNETSIDPYFFPGTKHLN